MEHESVPLKHTDFTKIAQAQMCQVNCISIIFFRKFNVLILVEK
jgi:hypothetical protein